MPDRIVRDDILDSDRYMGLSSDTARMLFMHFLLVADDLGNAEATNTHIRRRLLSGTIPDAAIAAILSELSDKDLIRVYDVDQKRYVHIPRFRQRLRYMKRSHPRPPSNIECNEIKEVIAKKTDYSPSQDRLKTDSGLMKRREVKRSEEKKYKTPTVYDLGVSLLMDQGLKESSSRSFISSLLKEWDVATVEEAFRSATGKTEVRAYVLGVLKTKPGKTGKAAFPL